MTECSVPGCNHLLYEGNKSGVCKHHTHTKGVCRCAGCLAGSPSGHVGYRIKTREEMEKEGLLR